THICYPCPDRTPNPELGTHLLLPLTASPGLATVPPRLGDGAAQQGSSSVGRTPVFDTGRRRFESCLPCHKLTLHPSTPPALSPSTLQTALPNPHRMLPRAPWLGRRAAAGVRRGRGRIGKTAGRPCRPGRPRNTAARPGAICPPCAGCPGRQRHCPEDRRCRTWR